MKMKILCAVAAMTLSQPLVAATAPPSFAGVQLGAAAEFPECEQKELRFAPPPGSAPFYKPDQSKICIEILDKNDVFLIFPKGQEPEISRNTSLNLTVIDGKVEIAVTSDWNSASSLSPVISAHCLTNATVVRSDAPTVILAAHNRKAVRQEGANGLNWYPSCVADKRLVALLQLGLETVDDCLAVGLVLLRLGFVEIDDVAVIPDLDLFDPELCFPALPIEHKRHHRRGIIEHDVADRAAGALARTQDVFHVALYRVAIGRAR